MAEIIKTDTGAIVLSQADYIHVTPYEDKDTLGAQTYNIVDIVADSLSFTPDDNSINSKESEFKDDPLFENVTLGKYQFAATCIDFQNAVMKAIYGWDTDAEGNAYAPTGYKDKYALVEIGFKNSDVVVVAPKVKLNAKATLSTFKTGSGEGQLAGTAYSATLNDKETPIAFLAAKKDEEGEATATYAVKIGAKVTNFKANGGVQA